MWCAWAVAALRSARTRPQVGLSGEEFPGKRRKFGRLEVSPSRPVERPHIRQLRKFQHGCWTGSGVRVPRGASWRWRDTLASEGLDQERSARDCRTPATRCDKGVPECASQGEGRALGDQQRVEHKGKCHCGSLVRYALRSCSKAGKVRRSCRRRFSFCLRRSSERIAGSIVDFFVPRIVVEIVARIISQERVQDCTEKQIVKGPVHQFTEDVVK